MKRNGLGVVLSLVLVTASLGVGLAPSGAGSSLTWNVDLGTGVEWRWVDGEELDRSPWDGDYVNVFREYGDLSAFETDDRVNVTFVINGTVYELEFFHVNGSSGTFSTIPMTGPNGTSEATERVASLDGRLYWAERPADAPPNSSNWTAVKVVGDDGFYALGSIGRDRVEVLQNTSTFDLDSDVDADDLVSVLASHCHGSDSDSVLRDGLGTGHCHIEPPDKWALETCEDDCAPAADQQEPSSTTAVRRRGATAAARGTGRRRSCTRSTRARRRSTKPRSNRCRAAGHAG